MCYGPPCTPASAGRSSRHPTARGFTLVEMLAVMTVIAVLLTLVIPAFVQVGGARNLTKGAYDITGTLEQARAYAKAYSTYTWVGFNEEAGDATANAVANGRVLVSVVASKDGTSLYTNTLSNPAAFSPTNLIQIGKIVKIDNIHLDEFTTATNPVRVAPIATHYYVGDTSFASDITPWPSNFTVTTFNYPILGKTSASGVYTFTKIIQFNPLGDAARLGDTPTQQMEIDLSPTHGTTLDTQKKNFAAVQVAGIGGVVRLYRP